MDKPQLSWTFAELARILKLDVADYGTLGEWAVLHEIIGHRALQGRSRETLLEAQNAMAGMEFPPHLRKEWQEAQLVIRAWRAALKDVHSRLQKTVSEI